MKTMKSILVILTLLYIVLSLSSCGGSSQANTSPSVPKYRMRAIKHLGTGIVHTHLLHNLQSKGDTIRIEQEDGNFKAVVLEE